MRPTRSPARFVRAGVPTCLRISLVRELLTQRRREHFMHDPHWQDRYRSRITTAAQAIRQIAPGRRILVGSGAAEPTTLVAALAEYGEHLTDNDIVHLLTLGPAPYVRPEFAQRFRHTAFFIGP